jgi:DNA transformation protein and related proteins
MTHDDTDVAQLKNIGPASAQWLHAVGISTRADLKRVGAVEAWRRAKSAFPERVTIVLLYALEGALMDIPWNALPEDVRANLRDTAQRQD